MPQAMPQAGRSCAPVGVGTLQICRSRVAVVRRHLPAVALPFALREIIERQLARSHAAAEHERAIAIISADVVARLGRKRNRRERFVSHARDMEMTFALAIEILFPQIAVPAFEQNGEETKFVFFAQSHRKLRVVSLVRIGGAFILYSLC